MKLNYKRTIYVGLAFFIITMFWSTYDVVIARILIDKFGLSQTASGVVMALDNILALVLLPVFGALSDRSNHKKGRRTPFIIVGTIVGALAFMGLSYSDHLQSVKVEEQEIDVVYKNAFQGDNTYAHWQSVIEDMKVERSSALGETSQEYITFENNIYNPMDEIIDNGVAANKLSTRDHSEIKSIYYNYLSQRAWEVTEKEPGNLYLFLGTLLIALLAMSFFRSPAVALMPDVTIKPLRSRANAVINLMGSSAAILALGFLLFTGKDLTSYVRYWDVFVFIGIMMLIVLFVFLRYVNEPQFVLERIEKEKELGLDKEEEIDLEVKESESNKISKPVLVSLILILASVFLWFMGYNAVISKVSVYAPKVLNMGSSFPTMLAHFVAIFAFIPIGKMSSFIGRRKAILIGITILAISFFGASFITEDTGVLMYVVFGFIGIGWATINVNSFPMVVELAKGSDVGKYTGFYYFASMAAQIITPILSGFIMDTQGSMAPLFPYSAIFVGLSFITMLFVRHGDGKVEAKKGLEAFDVED